MSQSDQEQTAPPGTEAEMTPEADHGETSYRGCDRLTGRVAVITGGDSGIGRAVAIAYAARGRISSSATSTSRRTRMPARSPGTSRRPSAAAC